MTAGALKTSIAFEGEDPQDIDFLGSPIVIHDASSRDKDGDGKVEFALSFSPDASLRNVTSLGVNLDYDLELLKIAGTYDIGGFGELRRSAPPPAAQPGRQAPDHVHRA